MGAEEHYTLVIAAIAALVTIGYFVAIAYLYPTTDDFFYADRKLDALQIRANVAATATSLAGALFFFLNQTPVFGWLMLLVPVMNVLGIILFLRIVKGKRTSRILTGSIFRFVYASTQSIAIARVTNLIVLITFVTIFLIEVVLGARIFAYFVPFMPYAVEIAIVIICALVIWYVIVGGFVAVANTDRWQLWLVNTGIIAAGLFLAFYYFEISANDKNLISNFQHPTLPPSLQWTFFINLVFINLFLPASQISTWQRYSSAPEEISRKAFYKSIWQRILPLWFGVIICSAMLASIQEATPNFTVLFDFLRKSGFFAAAIVFPVLFVGLLAALLSTADSMMISIMLAVEDEKKKHVLCEAINAELEGSQGQSDLYQLTKPRRSDVLLTGCLVVAGTIAVDLWLVARPDTEGLIVGLLFAGYGMPCLLFPVILGAAYSKGHLPNEHLVVAGLIVGLVVLWIGGLIGLLVGDARGSHLGPVGGIAVVSVAVCAAYLKWFTRGQQQ